MSAATAVERASAVATLVEAGPATLIALVELAPRWGWEQSASAKQASSASSGKLVATAVAKFPSETARELDALESAAAGHVAQRHHADPNGGP